GTHDLLNDVDRVQQASREGRANACSKTLKLGMTHESGFDLYRVSNTVLRTHEEKSYPGAVIASLSIPWGFNKGDDDIGGYHVTSPRDLAPAAGALIAARALHYAKDTLPRLMSTPAEDGHRRPNLW